MTLLDLTVVCLVCLLVGAHIAFLFEFWNGSTLWVRFRIVGVVVLLIYVGLSVALGAPDEWRVVIALLACLLEIGLFSTVRHAFSVARSEHTELLAYRRQDSGYDRP